MVSHWLLPTIIGESRAASVKAHCARVATTLKPPQTTRYVVVKMAMHRPGFSASACLRVTKANSKIIGAAEGTIMPTIITHHIINIRANVDGDQTFMVAVIASVEPVVIFWPIRLISPSAMSMARTAR